MLQGLSTERLEFRTPNHDDHFELLVEFWSDPLATKFYGKFPPPEEQAAKWLEKTAMRLERDGHSFYAIHRKEDGEYLGQIGVLEQQFDGEQEVHTEVGYQLMPRYWGKGYATEAAQFARDEVFRQLPDRSYTISIIDPKNHASAAVAQRNGMKIWRQATFHGYLDNIWRIDRKDWEGLQAE